MVLRWQKPKRRNRKNVQKKEIVLWQKESLAIPGFKIEAQRWKKLR
jgi:hypothetical protein